MSYSKDTSLSSGEDKNPSEDGLEFKPITEVNLGAIRDEFCYEGLQRHDSGNKKDYLRYLGAKVADRVSRNAPQEYAKRCQLNATLCHVGEK